MNLHYWKNKDNVPVYFVAAHEVPMIIVNLVFKAGSAFDGKEWGLAQLTGSLLNQGTKTRDADQIANDLSAIGADYDVDVDRDMSVVSLKSLSERKYLVPALDIFLDILANPSFPVNGFTRTQQQLLASIKSQQEDPAEIAEEQFFESLYLNHPYAHPVNGTLSSVGKIKISDAIGFYKQFYNNQNLKIVIVGDLTQAEANNISKQITTALISNPGSLAPAIPIPSNPVAVKKHILFPAQQTSILIGQLGIRQNDPNFFPLLVGNYILGDLPLDSLLFQEVRKKRGLAYDVDSNFTLYQELGPFSINLQTRSQAANSALNVTMETLQNYLKKGPSEEQLDLAKKTLINSFPVNLASNQSIANVLVRMAFYNKPLNYLDSYRDNVAAVTLEQVRKAFGQSIDPSKMIEITVGPGDGVAVTKEKPIKPVDEEEAVRPH